MMHTRMWGHLHSRLHWPRLWTLPYPCALGQEEQCSALWVEQSGCPFMNGLSGQNNAPCSEPLTFSYRTEELKGEEKRAHLLLLLLPPSSPPRLEHGTEGSNRGLRPIRMCACHCECLSCYGFSLLINAWFEARRSGNVRLVSLIAFQIILGGFIVVSYVRCDYMGYFKCVLVHS